MWINYLLVKIECDKITLKGCGKNGTKKKECKFKTNFNSNICYTLLYGTSLQQ